MCQGILVIRHGAIENKLPKRFIGSLDLPLSHGGVRQIRNVAKHLPNEISAKLVCLVSSDLGRCVESATILRQELGCDVPVKIDPGLREISLGAWEGLSLAEVKAQCPGQYLLRGLQFASFVPPGGESFRMLARRVFLSLEYWQKKYQAGLIGIVTHAGVMRVILARYLALPLGDVLKIPLDYGCYFQFENL